MSVDTKLREYIVVKPSGATPSGGYPVVFMFHGTSGTGEEFYNISGWKEKGQQEKFISVFPTSLKYCILNFPNNNPAILTRWFTGDLLTDQCPNLNQEFKDDVKFVRRIVDTIKSKFEINPIKIFAAGFSNGCSFSHKLAVDASDIFSGCAGVGSILTQADSNKAVRSIPFWNIIGSNDERFTTPIGVSELPFNDSILLYLNGYIKRMTTCFGLSQDYTKTSSQISNTYIYSKPNSGSFPPKFQFTLVKNMNHIYPNGVNYPVSATNLFWDFFNQSTVSNTRDNPSQNYTVSISPNPAVDDISIVSSHVILKVSVYNINGKLITEFHDINENSLTVDAKLQKGLHILQIKTNIGIKSLKVLINHH
ncbi:MAG: T9SS type A sorting domain-containing protein [Saprospiraceae bacterium]|nr:T9SS type A sorting domain-containing protein [Saprospiraceae bacterium]